MFKPLAFSVLVLIACSASLLARTAESGWLIDNGLKLHLAYFVEPDPSIPSGVPTASTPWTALTPESKEPEPDISNISLAGILGLGFPLPSRNQAEGFTFFLKFFSYPAHLSASTSFGKIFKTFQLPKLPTFAALREYVRKPGNVLVKKGFIAPLGTAFTAKAPFPAFVLPTKAVKISAGETSAQDFFDSHVPFSSIYVTPTIPEPLDATANDKAKWSAAGVLAFHKELVSSFEKNLTELKGAQPEKFRYFQVPNQNPKASRLTILKIQTSPFVFGNFRDLPMPHDPKKIFLSGLLLVYYAEYPLSVGKNPADVSISSPEFNKEFKAENESVLEVGSVVRF